MKTQNVMVWQGTQIPFFRTFKEAEDSAVALTDTTGEPHTVWAPITGETRAYLREDEHEYYAISSKHLAAFRQDFNFGWGGGYRKQIAVK